MGWATWKNRWENRVTLNEENLNKFKNSDLSKVFFSEQEASYFIERFEDVVFKQLDTWDYGLIFSNFFIVSSISSKPSSRHFFLNLSTSNFIILPSGLVIS